MLALFGAKCKLEKKCSVPLHGMRRTTMFISFYQGSFSNGEVTISASVPTIKDNTPSILNYKLF
jgi:hypothetical protein